MTRILSALCLIASLGVVAAEEPVKVGFSPSRLALKVGQRALVAIVAEDGSASGLAAFQLQLQFDPAGIDVLNPNEAFRGTVPAFAALGNHPLCSMVRRTVVCEDPDWSLTTTGRAPLGIDTIDNAGGRIEVAYGTSGRQILPATGGTLALIEVVAVADGVVSVKLTDAILADNQEPPRRAPVTLGSLRV